jgi:hypothetical protein
VLYRRLISQGIDAARSGSLAVAAPAPPAPLSASGGAMAAVLQARARLEAPLRSRPATARRHGASA